MEMENDETYQYYKNRDEWKDITPLKQHFSEIGVVQINYTPKFVDVYDYVRAVMVKDERSPRTLRLTEDALVLNPANYSVWYYRRNILSTLKCDLHEEMKFLSECISENQKNYQVWYHRQWLVSELAKVDDINEVIKNEFEFSEECLSEDSKNYHVWQYRQWLVNNFEKYDNELKFTDKMIQSDCYNNSAWNHRYYSIKKLSGFTDVVIDQETEYVKKYIKKAPENESTWNYLIGLYADKDLDNMDLEKFCEDILTSDNENGKSSPYLYSFYLEVKLAKVAKISQIKSLKSGESEESSAKKEEIEKCIEICELLGNKFDKVRANYWNYRLNQIKQMYH